MIDNEEKGGVMIYIIKALQDSQDQCEKQERERLSLDKRMASFEWENGELAGDRPRYDFGVNKSAKDAIIEMTESHYGSGKAMQVADILRED